MENVRELIQTMTRRIGLLNKNCCGVEGIDVSVVQSHILFEIERRHQPSIQQLAESLGMDVTTFSRQIQTMVDEGLVKKTPLPEDRRVQVLTLTEQGKRTSLYIDTRMNMFYDEIFSHLTEFEQDTVIRSLKLLNTALSKSSKCCNPMG